MTKTNTKHTSPRFERVRPMGAPLLAYRADLRARHGGGPFSVADGLWLMIADLVANHRRDGDAIAVPSCVRAIALASEHLGRDAIIRGCRHDPLGRAYDSEINPLRIMAEEIEHAGALRLAANFLDAIQALAGLTPLDRGRVAAQRARVARKLGDSDGAADRYTELEALAEESDDDELRARALLGRAAAAQVSGNYPETERLATACIAIASAHGYTRLAAAARVGLVSCAAHKGDFDAALQHAWSSIDALRDDVIAEAEHTANLGRLLLDMGRSDAARAVFARAATMTAAPHIVLAALGGLALASAAQNDLATARWTTRQVVTGGGRHSSLYEYAAALYECAEALTRLGHGEEAASLRDRAALLASKSGFHEVRYRAEDLEIQLSVANPCPPIRHQSEVILRELIQWEPSELPDILVSMGAES